MRTKINIKHWILGLIYGALNYIPPAPLTVLNILGLFLPSGYKEKRTLFPALILIAFTAPIIPIHLANGVHVYDYVISTAALYVIFFTSISSASYLSKQAVFDKYLTTTAYTVIGVFFISTLSFLVLGDESIFSGWYEHGYTAGINIYRYQGYAYEASHLALLVAPIIFYFITVNSSNRKKPLIILALSITLLASFSAGFLIIFIATIILTSYQTIIDKPQRSLIALMAAIILPFALYLSNETISTRIDNIISWQDSSAKGRSSDAFYLATQIAKEKSIFFGAGMGQIDHVGRELIINYYNYNVEENYVARLPSSAAEALATYGIYGLALKIITLILLYFKLKIYRNRYANMLFIFFFLYQFFGSFILSTIEFFCFSLSCFIAKAHHKSRSYG